MGKFVIRNTNTGVKFDLKATNGQVIATSEVYASKESCKKGIASVAANAPIAAVEDQTVEGYAAEKHPKFEIYKDKAEEFRFRLKAKNGQVIATSEGYSSHANCVNGVESVKKNAEIAHLEDQTVEPVEAATCPKFEIYNDKAGEFRFRLKARNGEIILSSEGYKAKASCENGIESVRKNAPEAEIVEE